MPKKHRWVWNGRLPPPIILISLSISLVGLILSDYRDLPKSTPNNVEHGVLPTNTNSSKVLLTQNNNEADRSLPPISVFFHIYVPKDEDSNPKQQERAFKIIQQQLQSLSEAFETVPNMEPAALYYTTVGKELEEGFVEGICDTFPKSFHCHHLQHLNKGFEEYTLAALHDHCQSHANERVIYIHTKGSYRNSRSQSYWRRHMTDAVGSRDCIERAHREHCDVCGLLFLPRPTLHLSGNMFNAKCSYVQRLLHPFDFQDEMTLMVLKARQWIEAGILQANLFDINLPWFSGLERYSMEHWHGSHPSLQACDVSNHSHIEYWQRIRAIDRQPGDWQFAIFPRYSVDANWSFVSGNAVSELMLNESARLREYFLLPGQLFRWFEIYEEIPPPSSWVWEWYPDGVFWQDKVKQYRKNAIVKVANQWRQDASPFV